MARARPFLIWLVCAIVALAGIPLRAACQDAVPGGCSRTAACCCTVDATGMRADECHCDRPSPEVPAPAPTHEQTLWCAIEPSVPEPGGVASDTPPKVTPVTASALPQVPLPRRSRQVALSVWQP